MSDAQFAWFLAGSAAFLAGCLWVVLKGNDE